MYIKLGPKNKLSNELTVLWVGFYMLTDWNKLVISV